MMIHATFNRAVIDIFNDQTSREIFESAIIIDDYVTHLSVLDNSISRIIFHNDAINYNMGYNPKFTKQIQPMFSLVGQSTVLDILVK